MFVHLEDPTVAAQTDSVHRVVGVGDCKHLEEGGGDEGQEDGDGGDDEEGAGEEGEKDGDGDDEGEEEQGAVRLHSYKYDADTDTLETGGGKGREDGGEEC